MARGLVIDGRGVVALGRALVAESAGCCCDCSCPDGSPKDPCCCLPPGHPDYCGDDVERCDCVCLCPDGQQTLPLGCCNGKLSPDDPQCRCLDPTDPPCCGNDGPCVSGPGNAGEHGVGGAYFDRKDTIGAFFTVSGSWQGGGCFNCDCQSSTPLEWRPMSWTSSFFAEFSDIVWIGDPNAGEPGGPTRCHTLAQGGRTVTGAATVQKYPDSCTCSLQFRGTGDVTGSVTYSLCSGLPPSQGVNIYGSADMSGIDATTISVFKRPNGSCESDIGPVLGSFLLQNANCDSDITFGLSMNASPTRFIVGSGPCPAATPGEIGRQGTINAAAYIAPIRFCSWARSAVLNRTTPLMRPQARGGLLRSRGIVVPSMNATGCSSCGDNNTGGFLI